MVLPRGRDQQRREPAPAYPSVHEAGWRRRAQAHRPLLGTIPPQVLLTLLTHPQTDDDGGARMSSSGSGGSGSGKKSKKQTHKQQQPERRGPDWTSAFPVRCRSPRRRGIPSLPHSAQSVRAGSGGAALVRSSVRHGVCGGSIGPVPSYKSEGCGSALARPRYGGILCSKTGGRRGTRSVRVQPIECDEACRCAATGRWHFVRSGRTDRRAGSGCRPPAPIAPAQAQPQCSRALRGWCRADEG
jgi:hypothetical protein